MDDEQEIDRAVREALLESKIQILRKAASKEMIKKGIYNFCPVCLQESAPGRALCQDCIERT